MQDKYAAFRKFDHHDSTENQRLDSQWYYSKTFNDDQSNKMELLSASVMRCIPNGKPS